MATRGSKINESDEYFDNFCSPCNKNGKNTEAVKFCADCQEYLCTTCVGDHNKFAALAQHTLLERSQFGKRGGADAGDLPSVPTERCKDHRMKLVDMYCVDHDSVGCHICFTITHRLCQDIHYIPEYIQTSPQAEDIRRINAELKNAISRMQNLMKEKQKATEDNNRNKDACLEEIKAYRAEINQTLDQLEKASISEVDEIYNKLENAFKEELKDIQETLDRLAKSKNEMESSKKNVSQHFVSTKICEKIISDTAKYKTDSVDIQGSLAFSRNPKILTALQNLDSLGHLQGQQKRTLYAVKDKNTYSVKLKDDSMNCDIWSLCILDTGDILLADHNNKKIKLVESKTYTVIHSMIMSYKPMSVCRVSATEAAVTCHAYNAVQFASTKNQLIPTRSLKFDHSCRGIAVMDSQLVVCEDGSKAYIYTMNGDRLKTIEKDKSGNAVFGYIRDISVSDNGQMIHVADRDKRLVTIDKNGNVIWKYSSPELKSAWGVCTDGSGNVFVTANSSKVIQIGLGGHYVGEVIPVSYGIKYPKAVCSDRKNSKLIVTTGNELCIFLVQ